MFALVQPLSQLRSPDLGVLFGGAAIPRLLIAPGKPIPAETSEGWHQNGERCQPVGHIGHEPTVRPGRDSSAELEAGDTETVANEDHERAVCLVAAQALARRRAGCEFVVDGYPDEGERTDEAVDMIGHDDVGAVAVEHTLVEAYPSQTLDNVRMRQLFEGFPSRFGSSLPLPGYYTFSVDLGAAAGVRGDPDHLARTGEQWVRDTAPTLPEPEIPPRRPNHAQTELPGPLQVTLYRLRDGVGEEGSLRVTLLFPGDIETKRASRALTALQRKAPKLEAARPSGGSTLLVLESHDFVLSNDVAIDQAIYRASQGFSPLPEHIAVVDTSADDGAWREHAIKVDDRWSPAALDLGPT